MSDSYDVIVIGSGAGGGSLAQAVARAGKRVLLLERGGKSPAVTLPHDEQAMLIDKQPYDDRPIDVNGDNARLYMGGVLGGSTSLYGAALMRPSDDDFHPGRHYGDRLDKSIHDWPIGYEDLAPYYDRAEQLYHVSGQSSPNFGPLNRPSQDYPHSPIPLKPINERLVNGNESAGLKPFVLPLGIDFNICLQCDACPGYICPNGARISAGQVIEQAAADTGSLEIRERVEVEKFERQGEAITGVRILEREKAAINTLRKRMLPMAGIIEDLPNPENRVSVKEDGQIGLTHKYSDYDFERGKVLTRLMVDILKRGGAAHCLTKSFPSTEHVAHQCGTLRF
jgi:choline dehydrogenase-like flavoprotein